VLQVIYSVGPATQHTRQILREEFCWLVFDGALSWRPLCRRVVHGSSFDQHRALQLGLW